MTRPMADWSDLKYRPNAHLSHIVAFGDRHPLCAAGVDTDDWLGTGDMDEVETAARLPLCGRCRASALGDPDPAVTAWTDMDLDEELLKTWGDDA